MHDGRLHPALNLGEIVPRAVRRGHSYSTLGKLAFLCRRVTELLAGLGHQLFEALTGFGPGLVAQRDFAAALTLALALTRLFTAAAYPLAVLHSTAVVG